MKHLKSFSLFESKTHSLVLPKNQSELDDLEKSPGFQRLKTLEGYRKTGCELVIMRNGGVEILSPLNYNFKVSPAGTFYYGGLKVGPKHDTNLDTWDKLFDYVYLYFLGTGLNIISTDLLENFVFHGVIKSSTYSRIRNSEYYESILDLARKYLGQSADEAINKASNELDTYISDPLQVLETPSYKFFNTIFDFESSVSPDDPYELIVKLKNVTPFGIFNNGEGLFLASKIDITLEGSPIVGALKVSVKTFKGLDKAFLNKIKELAKQNLSTWKMDGVSIIKAKSAIELLQDIITSYESYGSSGNTNIDISDKILSILNNWDYNKIEVFFKTVNSLLDDKDLKGFTNEYVNSEEGKSKIREMLLDLKNNNVLDYAKVAKEWGNNPNFAVVFNDIMRDDANIIKGGSMLRRFGFGDDKN
jgi:hypothetical protein